MMLIAENSLDIQGKIFNPFYERRSVQTEVNLYVSSFPLNEVPECIEWQP